MSIKMQHQVACNVTAKSVTFFATLSNKNTQLKALGSWIKQHREKANLSQETAAEKANLSRFQWMRIENGQSGTKRETLIQIAKVINADVNQTLRKGGFIDSSLESESNVEHQLLEWLSEIDFSIFDETEIKEIVDFIIFKAHQKEYSLYKKDLINIDNEVPYSKASTKSTVAKRGAINSKTEADDIESDEQSEEDVVEFRLGGIMLGD